LAGEEEVRTFMRFNLKRMHSAVREVQRHSFYFIKYINKREIQVHFSEWTYF
jgi:hypothetical protein